MKGTGERPFYRAEMFTNTNGEAQRVFTVNASTHILKIVVTSLVVSRLERLVRCLGIVGVGSISLLKATAVTGQADCGGSGWGGG